MILKKIVVSFLLLSAFNVLAQKESSVLKKPADRNQTFDFSIYVSSMDDYTFSTPGALPKNFMFIDQPDAEELGRHLTTTLFKKNRSGMEKTGRILTYVGVPLAILGGFMVAGADELYYNCTNGNCTGDARGGFGIVALAAGVGLGGTGGVLWVIGSKK